MGEFDHLWAGWRASYIESVTNGRGADEQAETRSGATLFERLLSMPDDEAFVVHRGEKCSALLNAYPYTNGHLLVLPNRAVGELDELDDDEGVAFWIEIRDAVTALRRAYNCEGVNVGLNLGEAAGAGLPDHVHAHVLPRWKGDTNFMTVVASTRVLPEPLDVTWRKVRDAWPTD